MTTEDLNRILKGYKPREDSATNWMLDFVLRFFSILRLSVRRHVEK